MRLLLDANLSPALVEPLGAAGHEVLHVGDLEMLTATDEDILQQAADDGYVVVTADSDFAMLLAVRGSTQPSVVLLRHITRLRPTDHAALLVANLPAVTEALRGGAIVSLSPTRLAVRNLPIV